MKSILLRPLLWKTLLLLFSMACLTADAYSSPRYWVFSTPANKAASPDISAWPARSIERRLKNNQGLTESDMPFPKEYLDAIQATKAIVVCQSRWLGAVSVEATDDQLTAITELPFVLSVQKVASLTQRDLDDVETFSDLTSSEERSVEPSAYGFSHRQAELARVDEIHRRGGSGRGVLIGVLDTGFQLEHIAFAGLALVAQYDFINHDPDPSFDSRTDIRGQPNHGTACLSVIAGNDPGKLTGIAPKASFALGKTEDTRSETAIEEDYWIEAIEWLEWLGADVVSSSLTYRGWYSIGDMDGRSPISLAAQRATELGMVICISAGNSGPGEITIGAPADAAGVLAIAAVDSSGRLTSFSSHGPASDGRIKPDVAAMGRKVVCVQPMSLDEYARWNGTSLACPIAAGVAALVIEAHPDWPGQKVVEAIRMSASQAYMPDDAYGYGLIDAVEAIDYPSLTILLGGIKQQADFSISLSYNNTEYSRLPVTGNFARFHNLPPGSYEAQIVSNDSLLQLVQSQAVTVPPSGSMYFTLP